MDARINTLFDTDVGIPRRVGFEAEAARSSHYLESRLCYNLEDKAQKMTEYRISIDEKLLPFIEAIAQLRGISVEEALSTLVTEQLVELIRDREQFNGLFDGPGTLSEHDEDILYVNRQAD
jgi:hypothetical protein